MKAYEFIEKGFCRNMFAIDLEGRRVPAKSQRAVAWCAMGAIDAAYNGEITENKWDLLLESLKENNATCIVRWSDHSTQKEVADKLRELDI